MARLRVLEESSPWEVRVAGELPDVAPLLSEAEDLRVGERLALLGAQDGDAVMGLCDAVISPMEDARGQADVLLAAWSRSLPVMASSLPRHEELDPDRSAFLRLRPPLRRNWRKPCGNSCGTGSGAENSPPEEKRWWNVFLRICSARRTKAHI